MFVENRDPSDREISRISVLVSIVKGCGFVKDWRIGGFGIWLVVFSLVTHVFISSLLNLLLLILSLFSF